MKEKTSSKGLVLNDDLLVMNHIDNTCVCLTGEQVVVSVIKKIIHVLELSKLKTRERYNCIDKLKESLM